ncbi:hypothetical protein, partial [Marinobacter sp.]|uniref:phage tail tube protein n=1 Tax=Marinobacter sp. TaxID=50741 RepID=UPI000C8CC2C9
SYGTNPNPTGSANYLQVIDLNIEPVVSDEVSRDLIRPYMGNYEVLLANTRVNVTFDVEMAGSGSAGTAPKYGSILKACGLSETITGGNTVTYAPVATPSDSVTLFVNYDGVRQIVKGCRGTFSINCEVNAIPRISFSLTGLYTAATDDALPTVTTSNQATPLIFKNGSTSNFALYGFAAALQSWNLDFNNEVIYRELVGGTKEVLITDRRPSGTAVVEAVALSSHNFFTDATGTSTGTNTWLHGTTAGNKVTVSCPQTDLGQPTYEESDGITMLSLPFYATPTSAGQNEFSLVYT